MQNNTLQADSHIPRQGLGDDGQRKIIDVAVGILLHADGSFLMTTRPVGKVYAGYWEFPGGKIEQGEALSDALRRELEEEIGITIGTVLPWKEQVVDYPHALVRLHFCKVHEWRGVFEMREGQEMRWQKLPCDVSPILPGALPVLEWLAD